MPRYLTAPKLALLLLIDVYTTLDLPPAARHGILDFLAARIVIRSDIDAASLAQRFQHAANDDISDFAGPLSKLPAPLPGRSIYDVFLSRVWALAGLDAAVDFIKHVVTAVGPATAAASDQEAIPLPKISRASPLGQFIRRSNVEFTRLQFADVQSLWSSFTSFRASSHSTWAARNPDAAQALQGAEPAWTAFSPSTSEAQTSTEDTSLLLSFSIHHLQKLGHRLPDGLKANLSAFLARNLDSASQSLQHFLAFFDHWRAGQYTMALESLHRYYDYSIASQGSGNGGREGAKDASSAGNGGARVYYQYALLHLSVLHADFERWEASVAAMEECVATARESQDTPCLLLALSWLLYLRQAHSALHAHDEEDADVSTSFGNLAISSSTQADEINFLKTKAREMKHWSLLSATLLDEARGELVSGNASSKAFEHLLQAQYLNTVHDLGTQMPATSLFHAAALERIGQSTLSHQVYANVSILHKDHIPLPERVRASCRLAQSFDQRGDFKQAMHTLDTLEQTLSEPGTLKSKQRVRGWRMVMCMKRELRRLSPSDSDNTANAIRYHEALRPFLSLSSDPDLNFEILNLGIKLQLQQDRRFDALQAVNARIRQLKQSPSADISHLLTLLLLKARIFVANQDPSSATTSPKAFSLVLRAAAAAHRCHLLPHLCEAVDLLAKILNELGEYSAARGLIEGILPLALELHSQAIATSLHTTLVDAIVGIAFANPDDKHNALKTIGLAETLLEQTHAAHQRAEDLQGQLDCLVKKRLLADWKGDGVSAEKADAMYMQVLAEREREMQEERDGGAT